MEYLNLLTKEIVEPVFSQVREVKEDFSEKRKRKIVEEILLTVPYIKRHIGKIVVTRERNYYGKRSSNNLRCFAEPNRKQRDLPFLEGRKDISTPFLPNPSKYDMVFLRNLHTVLLPLYNAYKKEDGRELLYDFRQSENEALQVTEVKPLFVKVSDSVNILLDLEIVFKVQERPVNLYYRAILTPSNK